MSEKRDTPTFITRSAAESKVREHWASAVVACRAVHAPAPVVDYSRARNYEIESALHEIFGGVWVVNEWCPFKGWAFSRWHDYCSRAELEEVLDIHRCLVGTGEMHPAVLADIENKIAERWPKAGAES